MQKAIVVGYDYLDRHGNEDTDWFCFVDVRDAVQEVNSLKETREEGKLKGEQWIIRAGTLFVPLGDEHGDERAEIVFANWGKLPIID